MKRRLSEGGDQEEIPSSKRIAGSEHWLFKLPNEVLFSIFTCLAPVDLIHLATTCRSFRRELRPIILSKVKVVWSDLINYFNVLHNNEPAVVPNIFGKFIHLIHSLRITDYYSYGEWQIDIFDKILHKFPNLTKLSINSINSSNWLKYRGIDNLKSLTLYFDEFNVNNSTLLPKPNNIVSTNPKIFNIHHLVNFTNLHKLELFSYHFNWDNFEESIPLCLQIDHLILHNCTWEYPFQIHQFNENDCLKTLEIYYSNNHSFILSERFNEFLSNPLHSNSQSIETLVLCFNNYHDHSWHKHLSIPQFEKFINRAKFPNLRDLKLYGWVLNLRIFTQFVTRLEKFNLNHLDLRIELSDVNVNQFTQNLLIKSSKQMLNKHYTRLNLELIRISDRESSPGSPISLHE